MKPSLILVLLIVASCTHARTADLTPRGFAPLAPSNQKYTKEMASKLKKKQHVKKAAPKPAVAPPKSSERPATFRERFGEWTRQLVPFWSPAKK